MEHYYEAQDKLLKDELDVLMLLYRFKQPDYYKACKNARNIYDYTGRGKQRMKPSLKNLFNPVGG